MDSSTLLCNIILFFFLFSLTHSSKLNHNNKTTISLSFPLTSLPLSTNITSKMFTTSLSSTSNNYNFKSSFKYSMALIVSLPIGTPPQIQQMVLDTGSQLSWIQCHNKVPKKQHPPTPSFDPSLSSTFSPLPCTHPVCKPLIPDFTLPTSCDQNRLCHYSYFYADGTYAEGNLVREKFTFSPSVITPPLILGCATESTDPRGILGMNLGRLSFTSQAKVNKFSYCVPTRRTRPGPVPTGSFYLGNNPNSLGFKYIQMLTFSQSQRMPNLDPLAYTVALQGIRIQGKKLNISQSVFRPDSGGSGQTMVDSGSEFTYLVDEAYNKMKEEVIRIVGPRMKKDYVYGDVADMCFDRGYVIEIERLIGGMVFEFEKGVEIVVPKERVLADVGGGVHCVGIGNSDKLGAASNIIGNFHQQNMWVEFDVANRRVGFGRADCSRLTK
ncbi:PREDICTED: aspartic proteinase PCS1-like [Lupinus angustifolius]|nr:PREDICTED: aspartic proteinase PCS1-like [Lupinus angustifolius]XP_019439499.1 PREDICTED: aspartic proteinase PCS1-like [Lupinus angustifolius]XP_019439500.1 PREDICTED: aspartic proteinase PCS1-like [Lupinus angustifolius]